MLRIASALAVVVTGAGCASSAPEKRFRYDCLHTDERIVVDGRLDEPAWKRAQAVPLVDTVTGHLPRVGTVARMVWDDTFLYVAFTSEDRNIAAVMQDTDEDLWKEQEVVEVFVCPGPAGVQYFEFEVNPNNARLDLSCQAASPNGGSFSCDKVWNCIGWFSAVSLDGTLNNPDDMDRSWSCEIALPLESLTADRPPVRGGYVWRIGLYRINQVDGQAEYSAWSPTRVPNFHVPGKFGVCRFVRQ